MFSDIIIVELIYRKVIRNDIWLLKQQMKDLMEQLLHVCNESKDEKEIAIIDAYGCNGKRCTIALTSKIIIYI